MRNSGMHILVMPSWYKSLKEPVLGTFFEEQARALMNAGHKVGILYPQFFSAGDLFNEKDLVEEFVNDHGLPTLSMVHQSMLPKMRARSYKSYAMAVEKYFLQYTKTFGMPDIIHAHSVFFAGIAAFYISQNYSVPMVITEHLTSFITGGISNKDDRQIASDIFRNAQSSIIVSHNFKNDIEKKLKLPTDTFTVVHNMVADLFFENFETRQYKPGDDFVFFTNSFLLPRKNIQLILDAIKILTDEDYNVKLRIGGDGPMRDELKDYCQQTGVDGAVTFCGALSRQQVKEETQKSHAFALASFYETFGVVLIESLACGRPVVTTDSGGPRDFIDSSNGIIVKENNPQSFADAMKKMIDNYDSFNQQEMSETCHSRFNEKKIESEIEQLYSSAYSSKNQRQAI